MKGTSKTGVYGINEVKRDGGVVTGTRIRCN